MQTIFHSAPPDAFARMNIPLPTTQFALGSVTVFARGRSVSKGQLSVRSSHCFLSPDLLGHSLERRFGSTFLEGLQVVI
jgi:hypothetical protein